LVLLYSITDQICSIQKSWLEDCGQKCDLIICIKAKADLAFNDKFKFIVWSKRRLDINIFNYKTNSLEQIDLKGKFSFNFIQKKQTFEKDVVL